MHENKTALGKLQALATLALADGVNVSRKGNTLTFTETVAGFDHKEAYISGLLPNASKVLDTLADEFDGDSTDFTATVTLTDEEIGTWRKLVSVMELEAAAIARISQPRAQCPDCSGEGTQDLRTDVDAYDVLRCETCRGSGDIPEADALLEDRVVEFEAMGCAS